MVKLVALLALVAGCEASLGGGGGGGGNNPDASTGGGGRDSGTGGQLDGEVDSAPACANARKLFLEFSGVTLTDDAAVSDAPTNKARWLTNASAVVPPWRNGSATRAAEIQEVIDNVKARLSATPIEVVTTRPVAGPYVMLVFGGARTADGGTVGTPYSYATSYHDCGDTLKSDVAWVSNMTGEATSFVADLAIGSIGWGLGLNGTTDPAGCMCGWANACSSAVGACTLSASIATSITNANETACAGQNPQNEVAAFTTGFCQ